MHFSGIYWGTTIVFIMNKFIIRPHILSNDYPEIARLFVLSLPNLCEAIIGTFLVINALMCVNARYVKLERRWSEKGIYLATFLGSGIFVITQELKIHNLGGRNVYDPYDVLFSIFGLILSFVLLMYIRPQLSKMETYAAR